MIFPVFDSVFVSFSILSRALKKKVIKLYDFNIFINFIFFNAIILAGVSFIMSHQSGGFILILAKKQLLS